MPTVLSFVPFCGDEGDLVYMYEMTECLEADLYNLFILTPSSHKVSGTQMIKFGCFHAINVFFFLTSFSILVGISRFKCLFLF